MSLPYLVPGVGLDLEKLELRVVGVPGLDLLLRRRAQDLDDLRQMVQPHSCRETAAAQKGEQTISMRQSAEHRKDLLRRDSLGQRRSSEEQKSSCTCKSAMKIACIGCRQDVYLFEKNMQ